MGQDKGAIRRVSRGRGPMSGWLSPAPAGTFYRPPRGAMRALWAADNQARAVRGKGGSGSRAVLARVADDVERGVHAQELEGEMIWQDRFRRQSRR